MTLKAEREARIAAKAAEKAAKAAAEKARVESNPIFAAIYPQRAAAIEQAVKFTRAQLTKFVAQFPVGGDLNVLAPRGHSWHDNRATYQTKQARHNLACRVLTFEKSGYMPHAPKLVSGVNEEGIERLVEESARDAALSFDEYVAKLTNKVGACDSASVEGHLWSSSVLTVTKGSTTEQWKTQQILNFSVYGKAFNQWPTRKLGARA